MRPFVYDNFALAIEQAGLQILYRSKLVHSARWQGADIASRPEMATHEVAHASFAVDMDKMMVNEEGQQRGNFAGILQHDIRPNMPWAEDHFQERVCGRPINPGVEWANWPYGKSAATFLDERGKFNHNYMERYWPKHAGIVDEPTKTATDFNDEMAHAEEEGWAKHRGIMYEYGDLNDVVKLLATDPYTRQAYLPVWFPEDTGGGSKRAPCTIGYHFLMREGKLDINYHIRSCDFIRHFRDDLYLTARLLEWVLQQCQELEPELWQDVVPGMFVMQIGSLHVFRNDYQIMKATKP